MPAGFNKGQVEYIKAVTNSHSHKTYKTIKWPATKNYNASHLIKTHDSNVKYRMFTLTRRPLVRDSADVVGQWTSGTSEELDALNVPISADADENAVSTEERIGSDAYLVSTHLRVRCTQVHGDTGDFTADHNEYRMIVFRSREVQSDYEPLAMNHSNPFFDLFHGIGNYNIGFSGYQKKMDPHGNVSYATNSSFAHYNNLWADESGVMRLPVNKESYVVMKDVRFFLGRDYGGKNIFETTLHWNWEDPISTSVSELDKFDNKKNYCWHILILGNSNAAGTQVPELNVNIIGTTHCTSD